MKDIETLLNKYFEGETTCEEERRLRRFFAEGLVPEHLEVYRPMFAFFEAEQKELAEISGKGNAAEMPELAPFEKKTKTVRQYLTYSLSAAAAATAATLQAPTRLHRPRPAKASPCLYHQATETASTTATNMAYGPGLKNVPVTSNK